MTVYGMRDWDELDFDQLQTKIIKIGSVCRQLAQDYTVEELFLKTKRNKRSQL
jgi:hypothetical protein